MIYVCSLNNSSAAIISGKYVINSLEDLYIAVGNVNARVIEIEDEFADRFFTPRSLAIFVEEVSKMNRFLEIKYSGSKKENLKKSVEKLKNMKTPEEFISYILQNLEAIPLIHKLCDSYDKEQSDALMASAKLSTMHLEQTSLARELEQLKAKYSVLSELNQMTRTKLDTLVSRINYKYGIGADEAKMLGLKVEFRKYMKVLYVKEITRVVYTDTLLYYLQEILKTLYGVPARFVVIESPYAYDKIRLYPRCKTHISLSYGDVYKSDIFMAGYQANLMEDIMRNPSNVKFLIVLDRSGWASPYIDGDGVETIYTVSDIKDISENMQRQRVLSYNKDTLHIPHIDKFDKLSMEEKIGKYSSMPTMQALIELLERGD